MKLILTVIILLAIFAFCCEAQENIKWIDAKTLTIEGKGWNETDNYFDRLPSKAKTELSNLFPWASRCSAGMAIRFSTNSSTIKAKWTLIEPPYVMTHQAATGSSGLDLYVKTPDNTWTFASVGRPEDKITNEVSLFDNDSKKQRTYLLYLPLYNGVNSLELGIDNDSELHIVKAENNKKILFYGTSITQGGCASRTGIAYPAIIGRKLDCETINLGFSGSAHMEPYLCDLLAELNPDLYVIDALPNMTNDPVTERTINLVKTIRKSRPKTPIILVECIYRTTGKANGTRREDKINNEFKAVYKQLIKEKIGGLYYIKGDELLGNDGEATVDGTHPTDLGFMRMAEIIGKAVKEALNYKP
jgi:hypothetical protein